MIHDISCQEAFALQTANNGIIVDFRTPGQFSTGHPKSAISSPYSAKGLGERLEVILQTITPLILLVSVNAQGEEISRQLAHTKYRIHGSIAGGYHAWLSSGLPIDSLDEISILEAVSFLTTPESIILDVREPIEWETGYLPGSTLLSLGNLSREVDLIPRHSPIAVICESGIRSGTAASILQANGFHQVFNIPGGTNGLRKAGISLQYAPTV